MKPEILDSLLLDRALDELPPDVAALLDAYLAQNPGAAARALELAATTAQARAAVALPHATPRAVDFAQLQREHIAPRPTPRFMSALRLAACLALGLGLGWLLRTMQQSATHIAPETTASVAARPPTAPAIANFWSVSRFVPQPAKMEKRL